MEIKKEWYSAIDIRTSRRSYENIDIGISMAHFEMTSFIMRR